MKKLRKLFATGLLVVIPIGASIYVIYLIISFFDHLLGKSIKNIIGFNVPGIGAVVAIILILIIGYLSNHYLGKKLAKFIEHFFMKIPLVRTVYSPVKDIMKTLVGTDEKSFLKVVLTEFPMEGTYVVGFITNENITIQGKLYYSVFIPTTPNPLSGYLVLKNPSDVKVLDITIEEGIKAVVSMASTIKSDLKFKEEKV